MGDVFLLGAGFSKAISATMPLLSDLGQQVKRRRRNSMDRMGKAEYGDNLEMWLTYLSQHHPWLSEAENLRNKALFIDISKLVTEILDEAIEQAFQMPIPQWLNVLINWWHDTKATIITLNYDTLLERSATDIILQDGNHARNLNYSDIYPIALTPAWNRVAFVWGGEAAASFRLYKLHGSINWYYSGSTAHIGETIFYTSHRAGGVRDDEIRERALVTDKVPFIVPPLMEKNPYFIHESFRCLWLQAGQALKEADRVFCLGYSLPVTDLTMRFFLYSNQARYSTKFYIIDPRQSVKQHFVDYLPPGYDIDDSYILPDPIPRFVNDIVNIT